MFQIIDILGLSNQNWVCFSTKKLSRWQRAAVWSWKTLLGFFLYFCYIGENNPYHLVFVSMPVWTRSRTFVCATVDIFA